MASGSKIFNFSMYWKLTNRHLGEVTIVVALHLEVEDLGLGVAGLGDRKLV